MDVRKLLQFFSNAKTLLVLMVLIFSAHTKVFAQDEDRDILRGQVFYRDNPVAAENVINVTTEVATATNDRGEFQIPVKAGDILAFTALNYELITVEITEEILRMGRLVVEVNEKITELDEIVVGPENQQKFLELKEEEFKQTAYNVDASTPVENVALPLEVRGMRDGINFVNIFRALFNNSDDKESGGSRLPVSTVLQQVYDKEFFVQEFQIPEDKVQEFLYYVDSRLPSRELLRSDQEFQLIDFLVNQSKEFRSSLSSGVPK